jgi:hypothetical protein
MCSDSELFLKLRESASMRHVSSKTYHALTPGICKLVQWAHQTCVCYFMHSSVVVYIQLNVAEK